MQSMCANRPFFFFFFHLQIADRLLNAVMFQSLPGTAAVTLPGTAAVPSPISFKKKVVKSGAKISTLVAIILGQQEASYTVHSKFLKILTVLN